MSEAFVLDSSAVICALMAEPGAERVRAIWSRSVLSAVIMGEVATKLTEKGMSPDEVSSTFDRARLTIVPLDRPVAERAGVLRTATRHRGLSLGDRVCLALAEHLGATAVTTDKAWADLEIGVPIELVR